MRRIRFISILLWIFVFSFLLPCGASEDETGKDALPQGVTMVPAADSGVFIEEKTPDLLSVQPYKPEPDKRKSSTIAKPEDKRVTPDDKGKSSGDFLVDIKAFADKSTITIGERIKYTIEVDSLIDVKVEFPFSGAVLGGFAVRDFGREEPKKIGRDRVRGIQWYELDTYTVGPYVIPPQIVKVTLPDGEVKVLMTPEIFVEVKSVIDSTGSDEGLRDIKEPLSVPAGFSPVILIIISGMLAAGFVIFGWVIYKKFFKKESQASSVPPDQIAINELDRIEHMDLVGQGKIKEFYYLVSNCLRGYLENRFLLKAPEQTTEEFLEATASSNKLRKRYLELLKQYLVHCDLVKYAKLVPEKSECDKLISTTRQFVEETRPVEESDGADKHQEELVAHNNIMSSDKDKEIGGKSTQDQVEK